MWQRKQTIYLILAILLLAVMEFLPQLSILHTALAEIRPNSMGMSKYIFCQGVWDQNTHHYIFGFNLTLFFLTLVSILSAIVAIFLYKNRKLQMMTCKLGQILLVLWYICFAIILYTNKDGGTIQTQAGCFIPLAAIGIFQWAYKGIKHDDDLVKSADRIR